MEVSKSDFLFADTQAANTLTAFLRENWLLFMPAALGFAAIYLLLPKARRLTPVLGGLLAIAALGLGAVELIRTDTNVVESILFFAFSGLAIGAGIMMITQKNPVHAALSFALVVLSTCGLFLLLAAPFLMAATIIVYAGAIVVTFLFVIMLAQQEGPSSADQLSREPFLASLAGCILLGSLVVILHKSYGSGDTRKTDELVRQLRSVAKAEDENEIKEIMGDYASAPLTELKSKFTTDLSMHFPREGRIKDIEHQWVKMRNDPKSNLERLKSTAKLVLETIDANRRRQGSLALESVPGKTKGMPSHFAPGKLPASNVAALGRTLFTDYLVAVELAAVLLLIATIGAIAMVGRRSEELR